MRHATAVRWGTGLIAMLLGATLPTLAAEAAPRPKPTPAPTNGYVALGDSYAAGTGAGSYLKDGTTCYRSTKGYPYLLATSNGLALNLQACSGATIADVTKSQLGALQTTTAYVTITVGGNDVGFADTVSTCAGWNEAACLTKVTAAEAIIASDVFAGNLGSLFGQAKTLAPSAKIVATAYPRLLRPANGCGLSFTRAEVDAMNTAADKLASKVKAVAEGKGLIYSDVQTPFVAHAVCDAVPWINNVNILAQYNSFHPNATGYASGYQPSVRSSLGLGGAVTTTATVTTGGTTSSNTKRGEVRVQS